MVRGGANNNKNNKNKLPRLKKRAPPGRAKANKIGAQLRKHGSATIAPLRKKRAGVDAERAVAKPLAPPPQTDAVPSRRAKRGRAVVDEWDPGADERLEASGRREKDTGSAFVPKPATFTGEAEEKRVRRLGAQMGDLAGPLLVSLWEADRDLGGSEPSKPQPVAARYRVQTDEQTDERPHNRFAALASSSSSSSSSSEAEDEAAAWARPATLSRPARLASSAPAAAAAKRPLFASATFTGVNATQPMPSSKPAPRAAAAGTASKVEDDDDESL